MNANYQRLYYFKFCKVKFVLRRFLDFFSQIFKIIRTIMFIIKEISRIFSSDIQNNYVNNVYHKEILKYSIIILLH